ncbi:MAG TPA: hypothetical protein VN182_00810 [Flavobacterium sp.]|nr:hypothetical protein [Flavobacterium sp.]
MMKTNKIIIVVLLFVNYCFSQTVNDYKGIIIPMKYDFQKSENQYRLQTITKMNLQKAGFQAFYSNESAQTEITDRCSVLYIDVIKENSFLITKLYIVFKDCFSTVIYQSPIGKSREKEFEAAYIEALNVAFASVNSLNYAYNGNTDFNKRPGIIAKTFPLTSGSNSTIVNPEISKSTVPSTPAPVVSTPVVSAPVPAVPIVSASVPKSEPKSVESNSKNLLYAQPTSYGYQLIDSEPKVVMKVYKTSNSDSYMAKKGDIQGALVSKDNQWFFEYYQNDTLVSEKVDVKF